MVSILPPRVSTGDQLSAALSAVPQIARDIKFTETQRGLYEQLTEAQIVGQGVANEAAMFDLESARQDRPFDVARNQATAQTAQAVARITDIEANNAGRMAEQEFLQATLDTTAKTLMNSINQIQLNMLEDLEGVNNAQNELSLRTLQMQLDTMSKYTDPETGLYDWASLMNNPEDAAMIVPTISQTASAIETSNLIRNTINSMMNPDGTVNPNPDGVRTLALLSGNYETAVNGIGNSALPQGYHYNAEGNVSDQEGYLVNPSTGGRMRYTDTVGTASERQRVEEAIGIVKMIEGSDDPDQAQRTLESRVAMGEADMSYADALNLLDLNRVDLDGYVYAEGSGERGAREIANLFDDLQGSDNEQDAGAILNSIRDRLSGIDTQGARDTIDEAERIMREKFPDWDPADQTTVIVPTQRRTGVLSEALSKIAESGDFEGASLGEVSNMSPFTRSLFIEYRDRILSGDVSGIESEIGRRIEERNRLASESAARQEETYGIVGRFLIPEGIRVTDDDARALFSALSRIASENRPRNIESVDSELKSALDRGALRAVPNIIKNAYDTGVITESEALSLAEQYQPELERRRLSATGR